MYVFKVKNLIEEQDKIQNNGINDYITKAIEYHSTKLLKINLERFQLIIIKG